MFYRLKGTLIYADSLTAVIDCGGVGFKCLTTTNTIKNLPEINEEAILYTHLNVREDALSLYGFHSEQELNCFKILTSVSGVGPKVGLALLSELTPENVALSVATGDSKSLTKAPGVGNKLAQRIILELKDKFKGFKDEDGSLAEYSGAASASVNAEEALNALVVLGYTKSEAANELRKFDAKMPVEEMIRKALKNLSKI